MTHKSRPLERLECNIKLAIAQQWASLSRRHGHKHQGCSPTESSCVMKNRTVRVPSYIFLIVFNLVKRMKIAFLRGLEEMQNVGQ